MSDNKKFWMVYKDGSNYMSKKHETMEVAVEEAKRIAAKEVGFKIYVFQPVAICETEKPEVIVTDLIDKPTIGVHEHILKSAWICPSCNRIYSPDVKSCGYCNRYNWRYA